MAKAKRKTQRGGRIAVKGGSQYGSSDDESIETGSVFSLDSQFPRGSQENTDEDANNSGADENDFFEDKLKEFLDGAAGSKSSSKRQQYLNMLCKGFSDKYCPEFLATRPSTMADLVEKSLRKGKGDEQASAATLAAILVLQYGASPEGAEVHQTLSKVFITAMQDASVPVAVREKITCALAITTFIAEDDSYKKIEVMEQLKAVFSGSFLKGDGTTPAVTAPVSALHQTALLSWALLLTVTQDHAFMLINRNLSAITGLLQCADVDMRVAAGEVLATMYEIARERDADFEGDDIDKLCEDLHMLATDSQKFRAKKDRKMQKSSFRDIEKAIRDGQGPEFNVQFGVETLKVRTWEDKRTYDAVCCVLGSGMNHHLQFNPEVRTLFGVGAPLVVNNNTANKITKFERHMGNVLADRNRTKRLAKVRDKRLDVM